MRFQIIIIVVVFIFSGSMLLHPQELGPWERVDPGSGFGEGVASRMIHSLVVYDGKLYVGTGGSSNGFDVWSFDGTNWVPVASNGLGDPNDRCAWSMAVYNNKLYVGTGYGPPYSAVIPSRVFEYDGSLWTQVNVDGFGNSNNLAVRDMIVYQDSLYAGVKNTVNYCEVWRYDGSAWTRVLSSGFGDTNQEARSLAVNNGYFYVGTLNSGGLPMPGGQVWESSGSLSYWTQVGNSGIVFGNNNIVIRAMASFNGSLYVGAASPTGGTEIYRYNNTPSDWTQVNTTGFGVTSYATHSLEVYAGRLFASIEGWFGYPGTSVWEYNGGTSWAQVSTSGFGNTANWGIHDMEVFGQYLYAGVSNNSTGCQVWRARYRYPVRASVSGGNGSVSPASQLVDLGDDGQINISPDPGYRIGAVTDNGQSVTPANPYVITNVRDNHNVVVTFTQAGYPPTIELSAVRKTEQAWIIKKDYAEININITEHPTNPLAVARYILYRTDAASMVQLAEYTSAGSQVYIDTFLESGKSYSYQVVAVDAGGTVVAESEIVTI